MERADYGMDFGATAQDAVVVVDVRYSPPIPITERLIELTGMTDRQRAVYELDATGLRILDITKELGFTVASVKNAVGLVRPKMRNVLRAEGFIEDGVPVPAHREPIVRDRKCEYLTHEYGLEAGK